jgi:glucokinase
MYIGIDIGGSHISAGLVNQDGKIISRAEVPNNSRRDYKEISKDLADLCKQLMDSANLSLKDIQSIGVGIPGSCNDKIGESIYANNLNLSHAPIRAEFQKYIPYPIHIENDANCAALAENYFGAAKGASISITITLGTGIGAGIVIDNKIFSGFNSCGSELGHSVIVVDGPLCTCGRNGCFEVFSTTQGLIRIAEDLLKNNKNSDIFKQVNGDLSKINGKIIFDAVRNQDKIAEEILSIYLKYLSEGIVNIENFLMPEVIVLGGSISKSGDIFLEPLKKLVAKKVYAGNRIPHADIRLAQLENDAGIIGAAMLGR